MNLSWGQAGGKIYCTREHRTRLQLNVQSRSPAKFPGLFVLDVRISNNNNTDHIAADILYNPNERQLL